MFADKKSGKNVEREELWRCLDYLRPGDTLVVPALDRLGRSLQDLISIVAGLRQRGIGFRSLHEALDTPPRAGAWCSSVRRARGVHSRADRRRHERGPGRRPRPRAASRPRPPAMNAEQIRQARAMLTRPDESVSSIARLLGVSRSTLYKHLPELGTQACGRPCDR